MPAPARRACRILDSDLLRNREGAVNQIGWFASGALLFLAGAGVILFGPHTGNDDVIGLGLVAIIAGSLCLGIGAWRVYTRVDWKRVEA